jgi:transposase
MAKVHDIRKAFFEEGHSISRIAEEQGIDRKTVRKYIEQEDWNEPAQRAPRCRPGILESFKPTIDAWLEEDRRRRRKQRHTAKRVYDRLVAEKQFAGSYRTVAAYVGQRKRELGRDCQPALPLVHRPGEAQVDFGEADYVLQGTLVHGFYLSVSFPYSNAGFVQVVPGENTECLFEALIAIFLWIGGIPARLWFDNACTIVRQILGGGERILTDRFRRFQEHFGFALAFCNPAAGHEKGSVESKIGYHRRNFLVPVPQFDELEAFNAELLERCAQDHQREHYRKERLIGELFAEDQGQLLPLPRIPFDPARYESYLADPYGMIGTEGGRHRYSTSPRYAGERVHTQISAQWVVVLDESLRPVVRHRRLYGSSRQESMDWLPYLTQLSRRPGALKYTPVYSLMPEPLQRWLDAQPRPQVGKAVALLAALSEASGFSSACAAVSESIQRGITDPDSLVALHDRLTRQAPLCKPLPAHSHPIQAPQVLFDPARYDAMLTGARHE